MWADLCWEEENENMKKKISANQNNGKNPKTYIHMDGPGKLAGTSLKEQCLGKKMSQGFKVRPSSHEVPQPVNIQSQDNDYKRETGTRTH